MPEFHEKECQGCGQYLAPEFWNKNKGRKDGLATQCKYCATAYRMKHREELQGYYKQWRTDNKEYVKRYDKSRYWGYRRNGYLQSKYGIDEATYNQMLESQGGVCAICACADKSKSLAVDHCHKNGYVRGLLCWTCNTSIGKFQESPDLLRRAADYLEKHSYITA